MPEKSDSSVEKKEESTKKNEPKGTVFVPDKNLGKKKVDFVEPKQEINAKVLVPEKPKKSSKRSWLTALIIVLIIIFLGAGGAVVYFYGDSLGIKLPSLNTPAEQPIEENTGENEVKKLEEQLQEQGTSLEDLNERVASLDEENDFFQTRGEAAEDIEKIEIFLKKTDADGDGISDYDEVTVYGTDPENSDTDGDGFGDAEEIAAGFNPNGEGKLEVEEEKTEEVSIENGNFVGAFALTDVEVSSNDIKLEVGEGNAVTANFTFEHEFNPYRVELTGTSEEVEGGDIRMTFDSEMISGSDRETFKTEFFLARTDEGYSGTLEFTDSSRDFLNNQKGEISFKPVGAAAAPEADTSDEQPAQGGGSDSPLTVPESLK